MSDTPHTGPATTTDRETTAIREMYEYARWLSSPEGKEAQRRHAEKIRDERQRNRAARPPVKPNPQPCSLSFDKARREFHILGRRGELPAVKAGMVLLTPDEWLDRLAEEQAEHERALAYVVANPEPPQP